MMRHHWVADEKWKYIHVRSHFIVPRIQLLVYPKFGDISRWNKKKEEKEERKNGPRK